MHCEIGNSIRDCVLMNSHDMPDWMGWTITVTAPFILFLILYSFIRNK